MNEKPEGKELKGKCQKKDCIHYGDVCCAMETECDGEEWYNKMPDGTKSEGKYEGVKGDVEEVIKIVSSCYGREEDNEKVVFFPEDCIKKFLEWHTSSVDKAVREGVSKERERIIKALSHYKANEIDEDWINALEKAIAIVKSQK